MNQQDALLGLVVGPADQPLEQAQRGIDKACLDIPQGRGQDGRALRRSHLLEGLAR